MPGGRSEEVTKPLAPLYVFGYRRNNSEADPPYLYPDYLGTRLRAPLESACPPSPHPLGNENTQPNLDASATAMTFRGRRPEVDSA
jgi:hypothetical protein